MLEQKDVAPVSQLIEEVNFNLGALGSRNGPDIDTRDWYGGSQPDFTNTRKFGFPWLDGVIKPPGNVNVIIQYAVNTTPGVEPPTLTYSDFLLIGVAAGAWGSFNHRMLSRFCRVRVVDTSNAANNGIYLCYQVRSQ